MSNKRLNSNKLSIKTDDPLLLQKVHHFAMVNRVDLTVNSMDQIQYTKEAALTDHPSYDPVIEKCETIHGGGTVSDGKEVKRWQAWVIADEFQRFQPIPEFFVSDEDHDRIVDELKEARARWQRLELEALERNAELRVEVDELHNRLYEYNKETSELKTEVTRQARVIEKLKSYAKHRVDCICRAGVLEYSAECDCGLAAIEKEGAKDD